MNEEIILGMVKPYLKEGKLTYKEFDNIFSMLSLKEQYDVIEILYNNQIELYEPEEIITYSDSEEKIYLYNPYPISFRDSPYRYVFPC